MILEITIPKKVESIIFWAFNNVHSIESVIIGDNVTTIGMGAFSNCSSLKKVVIGKNVTRLENTAFIFNYNLVEVEFYNDFRE